jgi:uncharacterized protein
MFRRLTLAAILALQLAVPAVAAPAMWKVSDADSEVYLFGSIHVFSHQVEWRTPQFDDVLQRADHVYFELVLDMAAYSTIAQLMLLDGRIRDGGTLWDLLGPERTQIFKAAVESAGTPAATFERMQPWMAEIMLSGGSISGMRAGVELVLDAEVEAERKRGFETMEQQMQLFSGLPIDQQIDNLMESIAQLALGSDGQIDALTTAWEAGDVATLQTILEEGLGDTSSPRYKRLITERNMRWVGQIDQILADNDEALVVVGAGHLVGPVGVPTLLAARGYKVERVDYPVAAPLPPRQDPRTPEPVRPR